MVSFVLIYNLINEDYFGERIVVSRIELDKYFFMSSKTFIFFLVSDYDYFIYFNLVVK